MAELARGALTDRPWGRTLAAIGLRSMSGQLTVVSDGREFSIVFSNGAVVGANSPLPADSVARVALTAGLLSAAQVQEVARRPIQGDGTDQVIEVGRLSPEQAARLRRRATAHRAARTFALERGEFLLTDTVTTTWHPDSAVDVRAVIYLGARLTLSEHRLSSDLGLLGTSFRLRDDAIAELAQFGFTEQERPILGALRQGANLLAVEKAADSVDQRLVRAAVYSLACAGAVDAIGDVQVQAQAPVRPSAPVIPRTRTGNTAVSRTATPSPAPATRVAAPASASASGSFSAMSGSQPPGPPVRSSSPSIPAPTSRTPTPPDPSRTPTPPEPPRTTTPPPPRRASSPIPRTRTSSSGAQAIGGKGDVRVPQAATPARNPLAASEIQSLIKAKVALVDQGADHFLLLGIKPDAPLDVVRTAFYGLVRRIHPDLLHAVGLSASEESQRLMARLNEAYAVLSSPERRREYEAQLQGVGGRSATEAIVTAALTAEERYRRGHQALRRDALDEAQREFEAAFELKKDEGDYLAMVTWARFCAAPNQEAAAASARQSFDRAARMAPESVVPRFWLGRLERVLGRAQQALTHFRWVVDQDPRHAEAAAEIRVLMAREAPGGKGLLKKR